MRRRPKCSLGDGVGIRITRKERNGLGKAYRTSNSLYLRLRISRCEGFVPFRGQSESPQNSSVFLQYLLAFVQLDLEAKHRIETELFEGLAERIALRVQRKVLTLECQIRD